MVRLRLKITYKHLTLILTLALMVAIGLLALSYSKFLKQAFMPSSKNSVNLQEDDILISRQFENIERMEQLLKRLLSFETSGRSLPPELLEKYFTESFQEKYQRLSKRTFESAESVQRSQVRKLSRISDNEWQAWIEIESRDGQKSLLSFRLVFRDDRIDLLTLDKATHNDSVPVVKGSEILVVRIHCPWNKLILPLAPHWLKQRNEEEFLIGFQKDRIAKENLEINCGGNILKNQVDDGLAFLDENLMNKEVVPQNRKNSGKQSPLEKKLQDALGFTVE